MKDTIDKLNDFIIKTVNDFNETNDGQSKKIMRTKGATIDKLNKVAILMGRLNKLEKDRADIDEISESDEEIIQDFLEKNRLEK